MSAVLLGVCMSAKCVQDCTSLVLKLSARFLMASLRRRFFSTFSGTVLLQAPHRLDARTAGTRGRARRDHNNKQQENSSDNPKATPSMCHAMYAHNTNAMVGAGVANKCAKKGEGRERGKKHTNTRSQSTAPPRMATTPP